MATGGSLDFSSVQENIDAQNDEILALQSIFDDEADKLEVLSSTSTPDETSDISNINSLKLYVPVKCPGLLHTDCYIPVNDDNNEAHGINRGVQLARSDSGQRMLFSFEVNYLPPVCLHVTLPQTYPSCDPPVYSVSCIWLSPAQLTVVCQHLDRLWEEMKGGLDEPGMPILYTWYDWILEHVLSELGITSHLSVSSVQIDDDVDDCRVIVDTDLDLNAIVTQLVRYNMVQMQREFSQSEQECSICFDVNLGSKFFLLSECNHHVCRECLASHCQLLVKEGTVLHIRCPMYECKVYIPPHVLRDVLTAEQFDRYETLSLQKGLEVMGDVTWCPRCNNVVIKEPDESLNLAQCLKCFFTFCTLCMDNWHQGEACKETEIRMAEKMETKKLNEDEKKRILEQQMQNWESSNYVDRMAKRCPKCKAPIMKIGGCNKVVCAYCHINMCYQCGAAIEGYQHFSDNPKCRTFSFGEDVIDNADIRDPIHAGVVRAQNVIYRPPEPPNTGKLIKERLKLNPELRVNTINCPTCRQINIKDNPCNHIRCWNCKTNMCYSCKQILQGSVGKHYAGTNVCQQHSPLL